MSLLKKQPDGSFAIEYGDGLPLGHDFVAIQNDIALSEMERARQSHHWLSSVQADFMKLTNSLLERESSIRTLINNNFAEATLHLDRTERIIPHTSRIVSKLSRMTLTELGDFCEWNVAQAEQRQSRLDVARSSIDSAVYSGVDHLHNSGFMNKPTRELYERTIRSVGQLVALDYFEAGGIPAKAYCTEDAVIAMAEPKERFDAPMCKQSKVVLNAFHEYSHAIGALHQTGFVFGASEHPFLEEAFVAHVSDAALEPMRNIQLFNPAEYTDKNGSYLLERKLLSVLMTYGPRLITVDQIADGFYQTDERQEAVLNDLIPKLDQSVRTLLPDYPSWNALEKTWDATVYPHQTRLLTLATQIAIRNAGFEEFPEADNNEVVLQVLRG